MKDNLLYKRCNKLEKENKFLQEAIINYEKQFKEMADYIKKLELELKRELEKRYEKQDN